MIVDKLGHVHEIVMSMRLLEVALRAGEYSLRVIYVMKGNLP